MISKLTFSSAWKLHINKKIVYLLLLLAILKNDLKADMWKNLNYFAYDVVHRNMFFTTKVYLHF